MSAINVIEYVDVRDVDIPKDLYEDIKDFYEPESETYHSYYPIGNEYPFDTDTFNEKLIEAGAVFEDSLYYHILLYFS